MEHFRGFYLSGFMSLQALSGIKKNKITSLKQVLAPKWNKYS